MRDRLYKMMNWANIEAIVYGDECNPEITLGRHLVGTSTLFQAFIPDAKNVRLIIDKEKEQKEYSMELADEAGFYVASVRGNVKDPYYYIVTDIDGKTHTFYDPYDFIPVLSEDLLDEFASGKSKDAYTYMGSHRETIKGIDGVTFRVWAPNALRVSVIGEFNNWNGKSLPMIKDSKSGIYSLFVPKLSGDIKYNYEISVKGGDIYRKLDPYANNCGSESLHIELKDNFVWSDSAYFENNKNKKYAKLPISIYEIELTKLFDNNGNFSKKRIDELSNHLKNYSYNYLKLFINNDDIYSLHGGIRLIDIKKLVNHFHMAEIGVLFTWNPSYFRVSKEGMGSYDGTYLYGHLDERKRYNPAYNGYYYNYGRPEVISFLNSYAYFFMREMHFDGYHIEGLSSMLYLDYGKYEGEWTANIYGGHENLEAIAFIKNINAMIHADYPYALTTTKEEGAYKGVTDKKDGLLFDLIYNNGFSEDYISLLKGNKIFNDVKLLTSHMAYAYCENYMVTMSKDDVLLANDFNHLSVEEGAGYFNSISDAVDIERVKRATLAYFYAHPGKKLVYNKQDGEILNSLGNLYKSESALYELDTRAEGFEWIKAIGLEDGVLCFIRHDGNLNNSILVVCNFSMNEYKKYKLGIPYEGKYKMIFNSNDVSFGGEDKILARAKDTDFDFYDGFENSLSLKIAPMSVTYYKYIPYDEKQLLALAEIKVLKYREKLEREAKERAKALQTRTCKK